MDKTYYKPEDWKIIHPGKFRHSIAIGTMKGSGPDFEELRIRALIDVNIFNKIKSGKYTVEKNEKGGLTIYNEKGSIIIEI